MNRRQFFRKSTPLFAAALSATPIRARSAPESSSCYPTETGKLRLIVPNAPGGSSDSYARIFQPFLEEYLERPIRIENVPGAGGLIGAGTIKRAKPDGSVFGLLSAPGLIVAEMCGVSGGVDPVRDFQVLCRIARSEQVWVTGSHSGIHDFRDLLEIARRRPIVFGMNNIGGVSFVAVSVASHLLGLSAAYVPGFRGSRSTTMAAIRGDVDVVSLNFGSTVDRVRSGDLRPLLQIVSEPIRWEPSLEGIPTLAGQEGVLKEPRVASGRDISELHRDALGLIDLIRGGRLVVLPLETPKARKVCLEEQFLRALRDPRLRERARISDRNLNVSPGETARQEILAASRRVKKFIPVIRRDVRKIRGMTGEAG